MMNFDENMTQKVWEKGKVVAGQNPDSWRKDECSAWIGRTFYGNRNSKYGWEIDHIDPDGPDALPNLRPLQWENNAGRGNGPLKPVVTAQDTDNVDVRYR
jgi:hypothetical protein